MGKFIGTVVTAFIIFVMAIVITGAVTKCDHTDTTDIYIISQNDTNRIVTQCDECKSVLNRENFRGNPKNKSYLSVIDDELVDGEYYTVTTKLRFDGILSTESPKTFAFCKSDKDDMSVCFIAVFKDDYNDKIKSLKEGDEITFYGRYSSDGFYWTNCELITE